MPLMWDAWKITYMDYKAWNSLYNWFNCYFVSRNAVKEDVQQTLVEQISVHHLGPGGTNSRSPPRQKSGRTIATSSATYNMNL